MLESIIFYYFLIYFWFCSLFCETKFKKKKNNLKNLQNYYKLTTLEDFQFESFKNKNEKIIFTGTTKNGDVFFVEILFKSGKLTGKLLIKTQDLILNSLNLEGEAILTKNGILNAINFETFRLELREPFKCWRIIVRGTLNDQNNTPHFVRLFGWWRPTSDEFYFLGNLKLSNLASIAVVDFKSAKKLSKRSDWIQWGTLQSKLIVDDSETLLQFRILRLKTFINENTIVLDEFSSFTSEFGDRIFYGKLGLPESSKRIKFGWIFGSDHMVENIHDFQNVEKLGTLPECFSNPGTSLEMTNLSGVFLTLTNIHFDTKSTSDFLIQVKNQFNSDNTSKNKTTIKASINRIQGYEASSTEKSAFILPLSHRAAQDPSVSGGKGSNLAKLYTLQGNFTVPSGMIVTVTAFENHLQSNPEIQNLIQQLLTISNDEKSVSEMEFKFLTAFNNSTFSMRLQNAIENELIRQFGANHFDASLFAVRSSAVGEDGSELSSAGQLETFLSVKADEIPEKILLCWASNYRREILNYRIQNGQLLNPSVAVVIQKLIYGGKSGVMFTNDPVKGDPNKIVVNMIDGLGEALVGGQQTPDEFVINKNLNILKKPKDSEVSNKILENLANLGIFLENVFGKPQDIEFAMKDDHVFVLQSRDITSLDLETDWEFEHEFDTPTISEHDILTTANVGEVIPLPTTALENCLIADLYDRAVAVQVLRVNDSKYDLYKHYRSVFPVFQQRVFLNLTEMYLPNWMTIEKDRLPEYALAGQKIFTTEMIKTGEKRFGTIHKRNDGKAMLNLLQIVFFQTKKWSKQLLKIVEKIKKLENSEVEKFDEKLQKIENLRKYLGILIECHSGISMFSSFTYVLVAIFVRGKSEGDLTTEELADISTIFAENSLKPISAEVPKMMKNLAKLIFKNQHLEKFLNFDETKKAMEFLMELDDSTGELARKFMEIHGHRGIDELSLQGETWKNDPKQIILNLKGILESMGKNDEALENELEENSGNVIDHLKHVQVQGLKRRIFQFFINQAHWGVYLRESAKSDVVYGNVALRNSCLDLGEFLHNQGYLPTSRSILHLTMIEIRELFETRNPRILHRMRRREKILEKQNENQYDFIHFGHPIPKDMTRFKNMKSEVELRGTAVCEGTIIGKARVAKTLNEAFETKPGEILITKYTDIGWSPLFPMIKGLVTEIGGLLSHGSVVAREYGLPCVIAVEGATDVFKTGDQIVLDGSKGTVKRILLTESENSTTNAK